MIWLVVIPLGLLGIVFAYEAVWWKKRADFWEEMYEETHRQVWELLDATGRYLEAEDSAVLRVWASQN